MKEFQNRDLCIATKHGKEEVIAPILTSELGVVAFTLPNFNTDQFGTFSGEVPRDLDPISTLRAKCAAAYKLSKCDLIVASEGSFGPHPSLAFVPADDEIVMLRDFKNNYEMTGRELSLETNYNEMVISDWAELKSFAEKALFPSHGLILKSGSDNQMIKGINAWEKLERSYKKFLTNNQVVSVQTDMRAMHNPTRMKVIKATTQDLIIKIKSKCPNCEAPGFSQISANPGLPCRLCGHPTRSVKSFTFQCRSCQYSESRPNEGKTYEDPMYCDFCNP